MFKVFAFLKRNAQLTHDEYRAGHIGYHSGHSRRMKGMRGYCVNVWANRDLNEALGPLHGAITRGAPADFLDQWDGFPCVHFDSYDTWVGSSEPEKTRAMAEGLVVDPDRTPDDAPYLFDVVPGTNGQFRSNHVRMDEHVMLPVERVEYKQTKLVQFFRRNPALSEAAFSAGLLTRHGPLAARMKGLNGYIANLRDRDIDSAIRAFYPPDDWRFTGEGRTEREAFCGQWDGANEMWFDSLDAFRAARTDPAIAPELDALERHLFEAVWYVEVDESVIVMPNRDPAPAFYYR
ncbi:EthD domain-containing protein [Emcibacter sp. SYSU 3D8]|uniref:EthD domain-containing protein n=1 Tax=Emcibacter sp. SYSU 3D8 TaxID=3133969 RepID=UPI0031FE92CA